MNLSDTDLKMIFRALDLASFRHRHQFRKGKSRPPYINHLIRVANILVDEGGEYDPVLIIGAILHDILEDTVKNEQEAAALKSEISSLFGQDVLILVEEVTDDNSLSKKERKHQQVVHAPGISIRAKKLKLADKISNVREIAVDPPVFWPRKRILEYFDWSEKVVAGLRGAHPKLEMMFDECLAEGRKKYGQIR